MANHDLALLTGLLKDGMTAGQMPFLRVSSGSMQPLLRVGDEVGVHPVTVEQLQPGDIVVVAEPTQMLTHRFWKRQGAGARPSFLTRGDRVLSYDRVWTADQLLGRAVARRRQDRILWLDYGPGYWLNRTLAQVSRYEGKMLNITPLKQPPSRRSPLQELFRLSLRSIAEGLTRAVDVCTRRKIGSP